MPSLLRPRRLIIAIATAIAAVSLPCCVHVEVFHPDVEGTYHMGNDRPFWSYEGPVQHAKLPQDVKPVGQDTPSWCWAAASSMLLQSQGVDVSQEDIVKRAYGDLRDSGGKSPLMVQALSGTFKAGDGKPVKLEAHRADGFPHNGLELVSSIDEGRPFIVDIGYFKKDPKGNRAEAYAAHSLLVVGVTYQRQGNEIKILSLDTIDPSYRMIRETNPNYDPHQKMQASEFYSIQGTLGVYRR